MCMLHQKCACVWHYTHTNHVKIHIRNEEKRESGGRAYRQDLAYLPVEFFSLRIASQKSGLVKAIGVAMPGKIGRL
jgi:hypothetical protein